MQAVNSVDRDKCQVHDYAALYPLYLVSKTSKVHGNVKLWTKIRWNPRHTPISEYESTTLEIQADNNNYKLEAWITDDYMTILIININSDYGMHPTENHKIDLSDPSSINKAIRITEKYLKVPPSNDLRIHFSNGRYIIFIVALASVVAITGAIWKVMS